MITIEQIDEFKQRFIEAKTEEERDAICKELSALAGAKVKTEPETDSDVLIRGELLRKRLEPVREAISLAYIARAYFKKSGSWFYQRLNNLKVNGSVVEFSQEELRILDEALQDISEALSKIHVS